MWKGKALDIWPSFSDGESRVPAVAVCSSEMFFIAFPDIIHAVLIAAFRREESPPLLGTCDLTQGKGGHTKSNIR